MLSAEGGQSRQLNSVFNFPRWHNRAPMDSSLTALLAFFDARRPAAQPLVLATIVATAGSTYRKHGARMLIDQDGMACGLLSGGCLEADLLERARVVIASGTAQLVEYDLRTSDDPIWGLGLGCEGSMSILLQKVAAAKDFRPLDRIVELARLHRPTRFATLVRSTSSAWPAGSCLFEEDPVTEPIGRAIRDHLVGNGSAPVAGLVDMRLGGDVLSIYVGQIDPPPHLLVLGGGPDAVPV